MQNKGFIRVVAVLLTLICLFYLSFSVVTAIYNNKAKKSMLRAMRLSINIISTLSLRKRCIGGITRISNAVKWK